MLLKRSPGRENGHRHHPIFEIQIYGSPKNMLSEEMRTPWAATMIGDHIRCLYGWE
jgi:hypothetical protein